MNNPNIIFIFADDMGYGDVGCYNPESRIPTPNMDRLAERGMQFTDAHAGSAVCTPSRYALLTGRYCWRTALQSGVFFNWEKPLIEKDRPTIGIILQTAGYNTACIGKWHVGLEFPLKPDANIDLDKQWPWYAGPDPDPTVGKAIDFSKPCTGGPTELGFDYAFFTAGCSTDQEPYCYIENDRFTNMDSPVYRRPEGSWRSGIGSPQWDNKMVDIDFTTRAESFISDHMSQKKDNPFFLYLALSAPHSPHFPPDLVAGKSDAGTRGDLVCLVDWSVGRVMDALDQHNIADNTLIIVSSDNGPLPGSTPNPGDPERAGQIDNGHMSAGKPRGYKGMIYDGGHREPFIARWPNAIKAGLVCNDLVCLTDMFATFADIVGEHHNKGGEDSISILPSLLSKENPDKRTSLINHSGRGVFALRTPDWKLVHETKGNGKTPAEEDSPGQLFNMREDWTEQQDLWDNEIRHELVHTIKNEISCQ